MKPEFRCFHCDQPAVWDGQFWRHDVSTQDKLNAAAFCDKYGYPISVRDADGKVIFSPCWMESDE